MRISDWSSDVCSSGLLAFFHFLRRTRPRLGLSDGAFGQLLAVIDVRAQPQVERVLDEAADQAHRIAAVQTFFDLPLELGVEHLGRRSEAHTTELQSLMRISYAVLCLKKKITSHTYI